MERLHVAVQALTAREVARTQRTEEWLDASVLDRVCDQPERAVQDFATDMAREAGWETSWQRSVQGSSAHVAHWLAVCNANANQA